MATTMVRIVTAQSGKKTELYEKMLNKFRLQDLKPQGWWGGGGQQQES